MKEIIFTARLVGGRGSAAHRPGQRGAAGPRGLAGRAPTALARLLAGHAPLTLRATKEALRRLRDAAPPADDEDLILMCYMSADFREGMDAFLTKRPPVWSGK